MERVLVNWKTTSAGLISALAGLGSLFTDLSMMLSGGVFDGNKLVLDAGLIAAGIAGLVAKDHDVTGGSRPNAS